MFSFGRHNNMRTRTDISAYVAIGLLIVSLLIMTYDLRSSDGEALGTRTRNMMEYVIAPVQTVTGAVLTPIIDFTDAVTNLAGLRDENQRLRDRITELEREVVRVGHLEGRVEELSVLLGLNLEDNLHELAVAAEVTGRGGTLYQTFNIDRGTEDGVHPGQPVVDGEGALMGIVSEVGERSATVTPITSRRASAVTVRLPNGRRGVVEGTGAGTLTLTILDAQYPVREGELLITYGPYGESDSYPKGLDVGTTIESASPQSGVLQVDVAPVGQIDEVEVVAVIPWPPAPDQIEDMAVEDSGPGLAPQPDPSEDPQG